MRPRPPNKSEMLAAALLEIQRLRGEPIWRSEASLMTAEQVISLFQCDHYPVRVETAQALSWTVEQINHPTNLDFKFIRAHREKTAKKDMPEIAKGKRVAVDNAQHAAKLLAKTQIVEKADDQHRTKPARPLQGQGFRKPPAGYKFNWTTKRYEKEGADK